MNHDIRVNEKRGLMNDNGDIYFYFEVTQANVDNVNRYDLQEEKKLIFTDIVTPEDIERDHLIQVHVEFTENPVNRQLDIITLPIRNGGTRSRKVKKSKPSKKRSATRRRRSSKRQSRKINKRRKY
jgi:hypothetical protein